MSAANPPILSFSSKTPAETAMQLELDRHDQFFYDYGKYPQTEKQLMLQEKRFLDKQQSDFSPPVPDHNHFPIVPFYIVTPEGRKPVSGAVTNGVNVMYRTMPGAKTPVCEGTDFVKILDPVALKRLKQECKVDVIVILVKNDAAVAWDWCKNKVFHAGLPEDIIANLEPNNPNARIALRADMPVIMMLSNPDLSLINYLGLSFVSPGLGYTATRATVFVGPDRTIRGEIIKATDNNKPACLAELHGEKMFEDAKAAFAPSLTQTVKL